MASFRKNAGNRPNPQKSAGSKAVEGAAWSRLPSLNDGPGAGSDSTLERDAAAIAARHRSWRPNYRPRNRAEEWMFDQIVLASVRIDRCQELEPLIRAAFSRRAELFWDQDRRDAAEALAANLRANPGVIAHELSSTRQGAGWMLDRWYELGVALGPVENRRPGECAWTPEQIALANDLLGVPAVVRTDTPWTVVKAATPGELVKVQIQTLEDLCEGTLLTLDRMERDAARQGVELTPIPELSLLRRYEDASMTRLMWAHKHFERGTTDMAYQAEMNRNALAAGKPRRPANKPPTIASLARKNVDKMTPHERDQWFRQADDLLFTRWVEEHADDLD